MAEHHSSSFIGISGSVKSLDTDQLEILEKAFRNWIEKSNRKDVRFSRKRVYLIFLLIRYAGLKLGQALRMNETEDFHFEQKTIHLRKEKNHPGRILPMPEEVAGQLREIQTDDQYPAYQGKLLSLEPAHVRKKFYQMAKECDFSKEMGSPEVIRKSRGIELLRAGTPLPVVQRILGHSSPTLVSEYLDLSEEEVLKAARHFMELESNRKTSARNSFYGKILDIQKGDIQTKVTLSSIGGHRVTAMITNSSLDRLGLGHGMFVTALIKAPWVLVNRAEQKEPSPLSNRFQGTVREVRKGALSSEVISLLKDGTEICAVVTEQSRRLLELKAGTPVWVSFSEFSVIINVE